MQSKRNCRVSKLPHPDPATTFPLHPLSSIACTLELLAICYIDSLDWTSHKSKATWRHLCKNKQSLRLENNLGAWGTFNPTVRYLSRNSVILSRIGIEYKGSLNNNYSPSIPFISYNRHIFQDLCVYFDSLFEFPFYTPSAMQSQ